MVYFRYMGTKKVREVVRILAIEILREYAGTTFTYKRDYKDMSSLESQYVDNVVELILTRIGEMCVFEFIEFMMEEGYGPNNGNE